MNRVILSGRLTADPDIRYGKDEMMIASYTLAVDRFKEGTDFIRCVAFDKRAQFAEKYLTKGMKIIVSGRMQTGKYDDKNGVTHYTTDVIVDEHEFCEKKTEKNTQEPPVSKAPGGFMDIPDDIGSELPFA